MDNSGNNRYELLFMDDDISDPLDNIVAKNKKQVKASSAGGVNALPKSANKQNSAPGTTKVKKNIVQSEKENKPSVTANKKVNSSTGPGVGTQSGTNTENRKRTGPNLNNGENTQRNANSKKQIGGEVREQRNRRNYRENGYNNNNAITTTEGQPKQIRENRDYRDNRDNRDNRENRGQPRYNRNFDGNGNRGGKREFDRQSGSERTGVKAVDKRDGAGAHNWGSVKDSIDEVNNQTEINNGEASDEPGNENVETTRIEEEAKEITLDEWKAQKGQRSKPTYNIRKAGEGEDTSQWKKMVALNNKKKENESEEELEFDPAMYPQRVGRQQRVLDIQFNFNDGRRVGFGGRGRGGRGQRGGFGSDKPNQGQNSFRPNGSGRGPRRNFGVEKQQNAPKMNDERQFPTLG